MKTLQQVREDLRNIRYYCQRKDHLKTNEESDSAGKQLYDTYLKVAKTAHARLYDIYLRMYVEGLSQLATAGELGYSSQYVQREHIKLVKFLAENVE